MAHQDFNDDTKDAGEIGAGHHVTALYEIVPAGKDAANTTAKSLKYQRTTQTTVPSDESFTVRIRFKQPDGDDSRLIERGIVDEGKDLRSASEDLRRAAAVAGFGMLLRGSPHRGNLTYQALLELAGSLQDHDPEGYWHQFMELVKGARRSIEIVELAESFQDRCGRHDAGRVARSAAPRTSRAKADRSSSSSQPQLGGLNSTGQR